MNSPVALLFPGQGAHAVGMGVALAERLPVVAQWYARAEEAAALPIRRLLAEGPEEQLTRTELLQPCLLTVEIGAWLAVRELADDPPIVAAAGHSLGEYAALVAAGALDAAQAVAAVRARGRFMQEAVPAGLGGMAAVMGLDADIVAQQCDAAGDERTRVWLSNDNCPGQVVVSGHLAALDRVTPLLKDAGAKRVVPLKVSAPFHCPLMQPAADALTAELEKLSFNAPQFPVIANCSARPYADAADVRAGLIAQVVQPVRFRESLLALAELRPERLLECGPGNVLSGLAKRTIGHILSSPAGAPEQIEGRREE